MIQSEAIIMDTHVFYWYVNQVTGKLSKNMKNRLDNAETLYVSAASCFELIWLVNHNRIKFDTPYIEWYQMVRQHTDIVFLDISPDIMHRAVNLTEHHKDPWDRIIIATALHYDYHIASVDTKFPLYQELNGKLLR